jgi:PTH1 family peptidyl-tRNA hydrolase
MKFFIVGLGNPGREYESTWHNLGFMLIDELSWRAGRASFRQEARYRLARVQIAGQEVLLVKPETYMNLSGEAVAELLASYAADPANLIVACDDLALPLGMIRLRTRGSAGGQKGLQSIIDRLGTNDFARLRMGIKPDHQIVDLADYVLSKIPERELGRVQQMIQRAADAIEVMLAEGIERAMAKFNKRATQKHQ